MPALRALLVASLGVAAAAQWANATVSLVDGVFTLKAGIDKTGVAWAYYKDWAVTNVTGFGELSVTTNGAYNDTTQLFAAGFVEGALTQTRIAQQYYNVHSWILTQFPGGVIPATFQTFFVTQDSWTRSQIATNTSVHWKAVSLVVSQLDGLMAGYAAVAPAGSELDAWAFWQLNAVGDFLDLIPALDEPARERGWNWFDMTPEEFGRRVDETTHCSVLVKVAADLSELWAAHVAWFEFSTTIRIAKSYNFATSIGVGQQMTFASYPGYLSSLDDFWSIWSSGLVVMETTNNVFNTSLYKLVKPQSLWAWQRVRVANLLASNGPEWSAVFSEYNSGTYNNQYQVVNVGSFTPGQALLPDTLWIVEQIPGQVVGGDATQLLELGHFPSYNVPFWPEIYYTSGYTAITAHFERTYGGKVGTLAALDPISGTSYQLAPRAKIFRRDAGKVNDTASFLGLMRQNNYMTDPLAKGNAGNAICSRGDLESNPRPGGCYDGKAVAASWWPQRRVTVVNGPTTSGGTLPPFSWSQFPNVPHQGLPNVYNFTWGDVTPFGW